MDETFHIWNQYGRQKQNGRKFSTTHAHILLFCWSRAVGMHVIFLNICERYVHYLSKLKLTLFLAPLSVGIMMGIGTLFLEISLANRPVSGLARVL